MNALLATSVPRTQITILSGTYDNYTVVSRLRGNRLISTQELFREAYVELYSELVACCPAAVERMRDDYVDYLEKGELPYHVKKLYYDRFVQSGS